MAEVHVRTIHGQGYTVDAKAIVLESDEEGAPGYFHGVRLSVEGQNVFIPMNNIDRIIWAAV